MGLLSFGTVARPDMVHKVAATVGQAGQIYCNIWDILAGPLRGPIWYIWWPQRLGKRDQYIAIYGISLRGHCEDQYGIYGGRNGWASGTNILQYMGLACGAIARTNMVYMVAATVGQVGQIYCNIWD